MTAPRIVAVLSLSAVLIGAFAASPANAALSLTSLATVSENFDFLANSGTNVTWNNDAASETTNGSPGWYWEHVGTSVGYEVGVPGSGGNEGSRDSFFSSSANTDKTMGSFNVPAQNTSTAWGLVMKNDVAGHDITSFTVEYDGEQWRQGGGGAGESSNPDKLIFAYKVSSSNITTMDPAGGATPSGWTAVSALDFTQLKFANTNFGINGNDADNRTANISATINATVPNGQYLAIRWFDGDVDDGNGQLDAGMGIDNFDISLTGVAVPEPAAFLFGALVCAVSGLAFGGRKWLAARRD